MTKEKNRGRALSFLFGMIIGNKGIPLMMHMIYLWIIVSLMWTNVIFGLLFR